MCALEIIPFQADHRPVTVPEDILQRKGDLAGAIAEHHRALSRDRQMQLPVRLGNILLFLCPISFALAAFDRSLRIVSFRFFPQGFIFSLCLFIH